LNGRVLVDTGPIVAILSEQDQFHQVCLEQLGRLSGPLLTCWPVIVEAAWLLRRNVLAVERLLASFANGPFTLGLLDENDLQGISAILRQYRSLGLQVADASLLHLANRERIEAVFTLDRRDFQVLRLRNRKRLNLIP
jgi:predicted nucleic acid-binding protein